MVRPFLFLLGYRVIRLDRQYAGELAELCRLRGLIYRNLRFTGDYVTLECSLRVAPAVLEACRDRGIPAVVSEDRGLPSLIWRYRHRAGLFVGALVFCGILFFSGRVVWSIRVQGNESLKDSDVIDALRECGMSVGDPISTLNTSVLENRMLIASDEISWISINMIGTVAQVEIREVEAPDAEEFYAAANLVAARSGRIEWLEDVRGNVAIGVGDTVGEGELLVGGIYEIAGGGIRTTCARGKVFARTEREFCVEIPLIYAKKAYTGEGKVEKRLIFFEKEIKFFGNTGNSYTTCDTINTVEYWTLPGGVTLPIGIRTLRTMEYETAEATRSEDAAVEQALYRLRCQMESAVPEGILTRKTLRGDLTEGAYILHCKAEYIENIAKVQEIEIEGFSKNGAKNGNH